MKKFASLLVFGMLAAAPALAKDKEPISTTDGDFLHVSSFKLTEETSTKLLNDEADKGYRLLSANGALPMELIFQKTDAKTHYEYKLFTKAFVLTTTKELSVVKETSVDGWTLRSVTGEAPTYTFIFERVKPASGKAGG